MNIKNIEKLISYTFKNKDHLKRALTHSSYANENKLESYETYEFLGDALLGFLVSEHLFEKHLLPEGDLTKLRASLVNASTLNAVAKGMQLTPHILAGKSMAAKLPASVLGDVFESLTAAIYLDGGIKPCTKFVYKYLLVNGKKNKEQVTDYKSLLQEKMQAENAKVQYKVLQRWGKPHDANFEIALFVNNRQINKTIAKSKKVGEQQCAKLYLKRLAK